jgi:hypothetical protein
MRTPDMRAPSSAVRITWMSSRRLRARVERVLDDELPEHALGDVEVRHAELEERDVMAGHRLRAQHRRIHLAGRLGHRVDEPLERDGRRVRVGVSRVAVHVGARGLEGELEIPRGERDLERAPELGRRGERRRHRRGARALEQELLEDRVAPRGPRRQEPAALVEHRESDRRAARPQLPIDLAQVRVRTFGHVGEELAELGRAARALGSLDEPGALEHRQGLEQPAAPRVGLDHSEIEEQVRTVDRCIRSRFDRAKERRARLLARIARDRRAEERERLLAGATLEEDACDVVGRR